MKSPLSAAWKRIEEEPVAFQAVLQAALALSVSFGLELTDDQVASLLGFTALLLGFLTRRVVTPLANPKDDAGNRLVPHTLAIEPNAALHSV
jgi:hypothetical protein